MSDSDKKLFPGTTQEDIDRREREAREAAEAARIAKEQAEREAQAAAEAARKEQEHQTAYRKFIRLKPTDARRERLSRNEVFSRIFAFFIIWAMLASTGAFVSTDYETSKKLTLRQRLRDAFWPISNGWFVYTYDTGYQNETDCAYGYNESCKGKFLPRGVWWINASFVLLGICILTCRLNNIRKENKAIRRKNKAAKKHNEISKKAVDIMLELKELGKEYNLSESDIKKIMEMVPSIIHNMSKEERVYFDMLVNDEVEIENREIFYNFAVAIMQGHLQSHPEDFAVLLQKFNPQSIPPEIMQQYGHQR